MQNLNKSGEKVQRSCSTPERMRLVESIKKSIHRSIEKINPADYKNILKGEYIYMHLCHGGEIINSEYTKVALFMGAVVLKKAIDKVTAVVTNQLSNRAVKKLAAMQKPVLSVLWLEACFQEKRKVPYGDFLFKEESNDKVTEDEKEQEASVNLDMIVNFHKRHIKDMVSEYEKNNNLNFLRFMDKKEKPEKDKAYIIPIHQIDLGLYIQPNVQKRKSQTITQKMPKKKNANKKVEFKSEGADKKDEGKITNQENIQQAQNYSDNLGDKPSKSQNQKVNKSIYEKYLKDFKKYESKVKYQQQIKTSKQQDTPCFLSDTQSFSPIITETPPKVSKSEDQQMLKTYSIKKHKSNSIKLSIIHPMISQKVQQINEARESFGLQSIEVYGSDIKNLVWVISQQSKVEAILAMLSDPKIIVSERIIHALEKDPTAEINVDFLRNYQIKCKINTSSIEGKKIVLLDSVMGSSSLQNIIRKCNATALGMADFLLPTVKPDFVITNKKMLTNNGKQAYRILSEASFIDSLIDFGR